MANARVQGDLVKNYRYTEIPVSLPRMFDFLSSESPCKTISRKF